VQDILIGFAQIIVKALETAAIEELLAVITGGASVPFTTAFMGALPTSMSGPGRYRATRSRSCTRER
jgi:hypothetical protein